MFNSICFVGLLVTDVKDDVGRRTGVLPGVDWGAGGSLAGGNCGLVSLLIPMGLRHHFGE